MILKEFRILALAGTLLTSSITPLFLWNKLYGGESSLLSSPNDVPGLGGGLDKNVPGIDPSNIPNLGDKSGKNSGGTESKSEGGVQSDDPSLKGKDVNQGGKRQNTSKVNVDGGKDGNPSLNPNNPSSGGSPSANVPKKPEITVVQVDVSKGTGSVDEALGKVNPASPKNPSGSKPGTNDSGLPVSPGKGVDGQGKKGEPTGKKPDSTDKGVQADDPNGTGQNSRPGSKGKDESQADGTEGKKSEKPKDPSTTDAKDKDTGLSGQGSKDKDPKTTDVESKDTDKTKDNLPGLGGQDKPSTGEKETKPNEKPDAKKPTTPDQGIGTSGTGDRPTNEPKKPAKENPGNSGADAEGAKKGQDPNKNKSGKGSGEEDKSVSQEDKNKPNTGVDGDNKEKGDSPSLGPKNPSEGDSSNPKDPKKPNITVVQVDVSKGTGSVDEVLGAGKGKDKSSTSSGTDKKDVTPEKGQKDDQNSKVDVKPGENAPKTPDKGVDTASGTGNTNTPKESEKPEDKGKQGKDKGVETQGNKNESSNSKKPVEGSKEDGKSASDGKNNQPDTKGDKGQDKSKIDANGDKKGKEEQSKSGVNVGQNNPNAGGVDGKKEQDKIPDHEHSDSDPKDTSGLDPEEKGREDPKTNGNQDKTSTQGKDKGGAETPTVDEDEDKEPPKEDWEKDYLIKYSPKYHYGTKVFPKNSSESIYVLYKPYEKIDFSIPFNATEAKLNTVAIEDIKISLFKSSAWSKENQKQDEYVPLTKQQIQELFKGQKENYLKRLLLSLFRRRNWKKIGDKKYYSIGGWIMPKKVEDLKTGVNIKYFKTFEGLKYYIRNKLKNCKSFEECEAKESELHIIDQDRQSFYDPVS